MPTNNKKDKYAKNWFWFSKWLLKIAGLWRPDTQSRTVQALFKAYSFYVITFTMVYFTFTEFVSLYFTFSNEYDFLKNIGFAMTHFMGLVKSVFWHTKGDEMMQLMLVLEDPEFQYDSYEDYQPARLSHKYKRTGTKYSILLLNFAQFTLLSSYLPATVTTIVKFHSNATETALFRKLPYYCWMPFRFDTGPRYLSALAYQAGPMFTHCHTIIGMDALLLSIMNCIGAHLHIIEGAFRTIRGRSLKKINGPPLTPDGLRNSDELMNAMHREMQKVCKHLQVILKICEDLENNIRYLLLVQSLATLLILCTCLYLVSTTPLYSKEFSAEIFYFVIMISQILTYCWFGNEITLKFQEVPMSVWKSDWFAADKHFKGSMILTMARLKNPVYLTAGKFAPFTLTTFMGIMKTSYSVFALIKNTSDA